MNKSEANAVMFFCTQALFLGFGFSRLINYAGGAVWISALIGIIMGSFLNYLFTKLPNKNNNFLITLYSFILLIFSFNLVTGMIKTIYLSQTPLYLLAIPLLILLYYITTKKEEVLGRVCWILIIITGITLLPIFGIMLPNLELNNFLTLNFNPNHILLGALDFALISTLPGLLLSNFKKQYNYKFYLAGSFIVLIFFVLIIGILGNSIATVYQYPEYMLLKRISFFGFMKNLEKILFAVWFFANFTVLALTSIKIKKYTNQFMLGVCLILVLIINLWLPIANIISTYFSYILLSLLLLITLSKVWVSNL